MESLPNQVQGDMYEVLFVALRHPEDLNDWTNSAARMVIGLDAPSGRSHLTELSPSDRLINEPGVQQFVFTVPSEATLDLTVPATGVSLIADLEVTAIGGGPYTAQARWLLLPAVPEATPTVPP